MVYLGAAFTLGIVVYAFYNKWILFNLPLFHTTIAVPHSEMLERKNISIYLPDEKFSKQERREVLWSKYPQDSAEYLVNAWLALLDEEEVIKKKTTLQTVATAHDNQQLLISFDRLPFNEEASTREKWFSIESLLKTIRTVCPTFKEVAFLVHHQPAEDAHLDFSKPWPIGGFLGEGGAVSMQKNNLVHDLASPFTIMLDPAGDAQHTGRVIDDSFERGITLQCAEALKELLEKIIPGVRIILTRIPGETLEPLQNAAFSNRLKADFYLHLAFYQEAHAPSHASLYYFLYNPSTDSWHKRDDTFAWEPYQAAHCATLDATVSYADLIYKSLLPYHRQGLFQLHTFCGLPVRPIIGIKAPALVCEIGLHDKDMWKLFVTPLAEGIIRVVQWASKKEGAV